MTKAPTENTLWDRPRVGKPRGHKGEPAPGRDTLLDMPIPSLDAIRAARVRTSGRLHLTPLLSSRTLADRSGVAALGLKCESLQRTGSFKARGALNAVIQLDEEARRRGVVTFLAGNHAQALAWSAASVGVHCTVVMPASASESKAAASAAYGAEVVLHGTASDAFARADQLAK